MIENSQDLQIQLPISQALHRAKFKSTAPASLCHLSASLFFWLIFTLRWFSYSLRSFLNLPLFSHQAPRAAKRWPWWGSLIISTWTWRSFAAKRCKIYLSCQSWRHHNSEFQTHGKGTCLVLNRRGKNSMQCFMKGERGNNRGFEVVFPRFTATWDTDTRGIHNT